MTQTKPVYITYLLAGRLLHVITVIEVIAIVVIVPKLYSLQPTSMTGLVWKYYLISFFLSLPVFSQLDGRSRYQNYKQIKDQFIIFGFDQRILKPVLKSRCQRDAAEIAARDTGYLKECSRHFRANGYRWYHLFPDFLFTHPWFLLTPYFWRTTFFTPTYHSRFKTWDDNGLTAVINHQQTPASAE
ncbi:MAG: hypothetical protein ACOYNC_04995 [Bacteroidales bacterium]